MLQLSRKGFLKEHLRHLSFPKFPLEANGPFALEHFEGGKMCPIVRTQTLTNPFPA